MRKSLRFLVAAATALVLLMAMAGCGEKEVPTIEQFMNANPEVAAEIEKSISEVEFKGAEVSVSYAGDCCVIVYKYDETFDDKKAEQLAKAFDASSEELDALCEEVISNITNGTTFAKPTLKLRFMNGDGSEIWSKVYESGQSIDDPTEETVEDNTEKSE